MTRTRRRGFVFLAVARLIFSVPRTSVKGTHYPDRTLMRRLFAALAILVSFGCGSDILGPVQTVDGRWSGIQNGYSMGLSLTQSGNSVSGEADLLGVGGGASGTVSGTFVYPTVDFIISIPGFPDVTYKGTMSTSQAKIFAKLDGSGFNQVELDIKLQK